MAAARGLLLGRDGARHPETLSRRRETVEVDGQLVARHGLTPQEARTVPTLAEGSSAREIAEARRVSVHTVRNQIRSAMSKMEVRRRLDVGRLIETLRHG